MLDLQRDALIAAGVSPENIYEDYASGKRDDRPGLAALVKAARKSDFILTYKLDRLGRDLRHLINTVHDLEQKGIGFKVLSGHGSNLDSTTPEGRMAFGIFASLAAYEAALTRERTMCGLAAARARGRVGGRPFTMTAAKVRLAQAAMGKPETVVSELSKELGVTRQTIYRYVGPDGSLREQGRKLVG